MKKIEILNMFLKDISLAMSVKRWIRIITGSGSSLRGPISLLPIVNRNEFHLVPASQKNILLLFC